LAGVSWLTLNNLSFIWKKTNGKTIVGLCQGRKTALRAFVVTFDTEKHSIVLVKTLLV